MPSLPQEDTLLALSTDAPVPWAQWMNEQPWKIWVGFAINDSRQKIEATRKTTFGEIKKIICETSCGDGGNLILWWMGEEMHDEMTLGDALGWRAVVETTLHCEDRELRADSGLKRSRSSRSPGRGVDLCSILHSSSK